MPTIISHTAPVLVLSAIIGKPALSTRLVVAGVIFSIVPDLDVLGFKFGVSYADNLGHRGLSHSMVFAVSCGLLGALLAKQLHTTRLAAFFMLFGAVASHIALDALTSGGLGVAYLWPWDESRYFFPIRPIRVSPFNPMAFLSARGLAIIRSELLWVWLPAFAMAFFIWGVRKTTRQQPCIRS